MLLADTVQSTTPVKIESNVAGTTASSLTLPGLALLSINVNELTKINGPRGQPR